MLDIKEGDVLVVGANEYPIKASAEWAGMKVTSSFRRLATISASTKRATTSGGKRSAATTYLSGLSMTPLDPVSAELASSVGLSTPHELKQCYCGDSTGFLHLVIEDLKR